MDFIIKFLKFKNPTTAIIYNSIMVVINKLIKYVHYIPSIKTYNTKQLKHFYINKIIKY